LNFTFVNFQSPYIALAFTLFAGGATPGTLAISSFDSSNALTGTGAFSISSGQTVTQQFVNFSPSISDLSGHVVFEATNGLVWNITSVQLRLQNNSSLSDTLMFSGDQLVATPVPTTPLPAAFPLFATGLGALGLLGWRRKRKQAVV